MDDKKRFGVNTHLQSLLYGRVGDLHKSIDDAGNDADLDVEVSIELDKLINKIVYCIQKGIVEGTIR